MSAVAVTIAFGMFDTHSENVMITDEKKIKFFDNTRSFPNSNGLIDSGERLISPFRTILLDLPLAHEPLSSEEKGQLRSQVNSMKEKVDDDFENFLNKNKEQIEGLPHGWLDANGALNAMKERLDLMQKVLKKDIGNVTLMDLSLKSVPGYSFTFALHLMSYLEHSKVEHEWLINDPASEICYAYR